MKNKILTFWIFIVLFTIHTWSQGTIEALAIGAHQAVSKRSKVTPPILESDTLLTLGVPYNYTPVYGRIKHGADSIRESGMVNQIDFMPQAIKPADGGYWVYGIGRNQQKTPRIWRVFTKDGYTLTDRTVLYDLPPTPETNSRWITSQMAVGDDKLLLIQLSFGKPPRKGHFFYAFGTGSNDQDWRPLQNEIIYKGQDAFSIVWNPSLRRFVNYQTTYQLYNKRFADNISPVRRVLSIRTSPDGISWDPGDSFGVDGPHMDIDKLILPDSLDSEDTEFYKFSVIDLGEFWAGIMVNYVSQPKEFPNTSPWPHGPFLSYEWWISRDGMTWDRPFRETSNLDNTPYDIGYRLHAPLQIGNELRWIANKRIHTMNRSRIFYLYSRANAEILTIPIQLRGKPITVEVDFFERDANYPAQLSGALHQSYVMAELVDDMGNTIPGFERSKCLFRKSDNGKLTLQWEDKFLPEDNSIRVQVRILFRDVRLYSLSY